MSLPTVSRLQAFLESRRIVTNPVAVFGSLMAELGDDYIYYFGGVKRVRVTSNPIVLRRVPEGQLRKLSQV